MIQIRPLQPTRSLAPNETQAEEINGVRPLQTVKRAITACALFALAAVAFPGRAAAGEAALFGGTIYYSGTQADLDKVKSSGFTTAIVWTLGVDSNGDINLSGNPLVTNGVYVGDANFPGRLATLRNFPTTINRVEFSVGAWGSGAWQSIKDQLATYGTGSSTRLYRNFQTLKNVTGADAISSDDEVTYDVASTVSFGNMLSNMGYSFTLCPYTNPSFWQQVKSQLGDKIDRIYLQCYDGGAANNPATWNTYFGGMKVIPGVWGRHYSNSTGDTPATVNSKMNGWRTSSGASGGFYWMADDLLSDPSNGTYAQYGNAIQTAFGGVSAGTYFVVNRNSGLPLDASGAGTGNGTPFIQSTFNGNTNQQWDLGVDDSNHFVLTGVGSGRVATVDGYSFADNGIVNLWDNIGALHQKFTLVDKGSGYFNVVFAHSGKAMQTLGSSTASGAAIVQNGNVTGNNAQWHFQRTLRAGTYSVLVRHTGMALDASGAGTANGTPLIQSRYHSGSNQQWIVTSLGGGQFSLTGVGSGRVATVDGYSYADNGIINLWDNIGALHQKFTLVDQGQGWLSVVFMHSGKAMEVLYNSSAAGAAVGQYTLGAHGANSQWSFRNP
jgi:hypothetical protein